MKTKFSLFAVIGCIIFLVGCKQTKERKTDSGLRYILYQENSGPKAKIGDYVTVILIYKTENDSVLFDSRQNNRPLRFQLQKPAFRGSLEDGITYLATGDSATFFISADSMIRKVFSKLGGPQYVRPSFLKDGSFLKYDIKLLRIQSELDASEEMFHDLDRRSAQEKADIEKYISDHKITQLPDSNGIYLIKNIEGKGAEIDSGKTVLLKYTGKLLSGEIFNSSGDNGRSYSFVVGTGTVIRGWDIAFKKLRKGDRVTIILPSKLAFGEEGVRNKMNGTFLVQPNSPVLFEIDVVDVK
jgi:FKBP-type peptidyl-prolyl cis-trans isomerase FkpA